jgi:transposase, IS6 family
MDRCRIYPAAIRESQAEGRLPQRRRRRTERYANNRIESDHRHVKGRLGAMQGPRTMPTALRVIQGIDLSERRFLQEKIQTLRTPVPKNDLGSQLTRFG